MLDNVIEDKDFAKLMMKNLQDTMMLFFEKEQNFGILCKIEHVEFDPPLPEEITASFRPITLFFLGGYTFESARIDGDYLIFEAGFGANNIGSIVSVPILAILQILVDETPLVINLADYKKHLEVSEAKIDEEGVKNSMSSFLSNPENAKFLK